VRDFRLAKATKPSQLSSRAERTLNLLYEMNSLLSSIGIEKHFIDAEWASTDPRFSDLSILLEEQRDVTLVVTISVRRSDADMRVKEFIEMSQSYSNLQPCLVPGNPAYLSPHELCKNSIKLIEEYVRKIRRTYDGTMYVGCEKIEKASARIAGLYNMTLFHVYRRSKLEDFLSLADERLTAIYTPVILDNLNAAARSYVARRLGANDPDSDFMKHAINEYVLSLANDGVHILKHLRRRCVTLVIQPFSNSVLTIQEVFRRVGTCVSR